MRSAKAIQRVIGVLCLLGLGVAGYLTWSHLAGSDPYCGASSSCADVQNSPYSEIAGVPVALIGVLGYVVLLVLSLLRGRFNAEIEFYLPVVNFGAALIGVLYSAYLTYLEAYVIRAWCYWCVTSAVIIVAVWLLSILDLRIAWAVE